MSAKKIGEEKILKVIEILIFRDMPLRHIQQLHAHT